MKKFAIILAAAVVGLAVAAGSQAQAAVSTFIIDQADFRLDGFSTGTGPTTSTPTTGPITYDITNVTGGSYSLDIPPLGTSWDVYSSGSFWLDFDKSGGDPDATGTWNEYLGNLVSPGPGGIDTHWGPGNVDLSIDYVKGENTGTFIWNLAYEVDFDNPATPSGSFGPNALGSYTLTGVGYLGSLALQEVNAQLTDWDNAGGGGDGIIDGWMGYTQHITCVPEPGTMIVWALLGAASWLGMGVWRRGRPVGRQPWSDENRTAILEIIDRDRA